MEWVVGRNVELLERTLDWITMNPDAHDQTWYFMQTECGTAACFAGTACLLSGDTPTWWDEHGLSQMTRHDGQVYPVRSRAQELLGLTYDESITLFWGYNTKAMLDLMVADLVQGRELGTVEDYRVKASRPLQVA